MKRHLLLSALAVAGVFAFGPTAKARERTADLNAPLILRSTLEAPGPTTVARRGNRIFLYNHGGNIERTTLVTPGPAVMPAAIAEGPRARVTTRRMMPERSWTRTSFITSSQSPKLVVERPARTMFVRKGSQPEAIAEGPVRSTVITSSRPEVISESTAFGVEKSGGLEPDGDTLLGRGPHLKGRPD